MASFLARKSCKNDEKERKQKLSLRFDPTRRVIENSKKKGKNSKNKKYRYVFFSSQNRFEKDEIRRK